jgi:hypothetical protein
MKTVLSFLLLFSLNTVANERDVKSTARSHQNPHPQFSLKIEDAYYDWGGPPATDRPPSEIVAQVRADCATHLSSSDDPTATVELNRPHWIVRAQCWDRHFGKIDQVTAFAERTQQEEDSMREQEYEERRSRIPSQPRTILVETLMQRCWEYYDKHWDLPNDLQQPGDWAAVSEYAGVSGQQNLAICRIHHGQRQEKLIGLDVCSNKEASRHRDFGLCPDYKTVLRPPGFRDRAIEKCVKDWSDRRKHRDELDYTYEDSGRRLPGSEDDRIHFRYEETGWVTIVSCWTHPASDQTLHIAMTPPDWTDVGGIPADAIDPYGNSFTFTTRGIIGNLFRYAFIHLLVP